MRIALVHNAMFPVRAYGGTERAIWWLAKNLSERGHEVTLVCRSGSSCPFAKVEPHDFSSDLPPLTEVDIFHFFYTPARNPNRPFVVTIEGNGKSGEEFSQNTIFVSQNHAMRHGAEAYVYNGIDLDEYAFCDNKSRFLIFLAKASWNVKNVKGAIRIAKSGGWPLHIMGGTRWMQTPWSNIRWEGMVAGQKKQDLLTKASALLFPVLWHEPFGIAVIEALACGTPVLATPFGSLPELVPPEAGWICRSEADFVSNLGRIGAVRAKDCRSWVEANFSHRRMTENYLVAYEKVLSGKALNRAQPKVLREAGAILQFPAQTQ